MSDLVAEPNQTVMDEQNSLSWISSLGEVQPLLGLFSNGVYVSVPLQVLRDGGAHELEWLHCCYSAVCDGECGECRGVLPEVHNHLPCFERVQLQVVVTAPDSQLFFLSVSRLVSIVDEANDGSVSKFQDLDRGVFCSAFVYREKSSGESTHPWGAPVLIVIVLDVSLSSLTSCCLSVRKLVIHWQMKVGTESWVSLSERRSGMMVLKAELKSTNNILA